MTEFEDLNSPEAREARHAARMEKRRAAFLPVQNELLKLGLDCQSASDIERFAPLSDDVVAVILGMVEAVAREEVVVAEMMVRMLGLAANKFDGAILERLLLKEVATPFEFALANTLLIVEPT